jgi:antitoxin ParD1/3/4
MSKLITAHLPDHLARFAEAEVAAGRFTSVDDVIEAGVETLRKRQERHDAKVKAVDAALEEGERSGMFEGDAFASVRAELGLPSR